MNAKTHNAIRSGATDVDVAGTLGAPERLVRASRTDWLPMLSEVSGLTTPEEAAAAVLRHLRAGFGPELAAEVVLNVPQPERVAVLGSRIESPFTVRWRDGEREIGHLSVDALPEPQRASLREVAIWLQPTMARLAVAHARELAFRDATRQARRLRLRADLLALAQSPQSVSAYLQHVVTFLQAWFDAAQVVLWTHRGPQGELLPACRAFAHRPELEVPVPAGVLQEALANRQVCTATVGQAQPRLFLVGPLLDEESLEGVLQVLLPGVFLDHEAEEELTIACEVVAVGLRTVRFYEQLSFHASHDPLTGLANRRTFDQLLAREFKLAERHGSPLGVLMVDVDHFKLFNDTHGHPAGDALLRQVAAALAGAVRSTDFVARFGGEEFVVVLPHTGSVGAVSAANKVLEAIRTLKTAHGPVTVSVGGATYPVQARDAADLVEQADQALYRAKQAGRNQTCFAGEQA